MRFDLTSSPIEDCYKILEKGGFKVPQEEAEKVDTFRHKFKKMLELAGDVQATLVEVQFPFKEKLLEEVLQLAVVSKEFYDVYNAEGELFVLCCCCCC